MDLIRLILLDLEGASDIGLPDYSNKRQDYHRILVAEADLAKAINMSTNLGKRLCCCAQHGLAMISLMQLGMKLTGNESPR